MKAVEQIKDGYGNLIDLYGVYEIINIKQIDKNLAYPRKRQVKKLISTHPTLALARKALK